LNDIITYLRISAAEASKTLATTVIDTQEKAQVYEKLGEGKSQQKIEDETGIANQTISEWIRKFVENGLVSPPNEYVKTYKALFTLRELGINPIELKKRKKKELTMADAKKGKQNAKETKEGVTIQ
jgi:transposase-like protein